MHQPSFSFQKIALVKEIESPENPGGLEKRVALIPKDVGTLVKVGVNVFVEYGAGEGIGYADSEYIEQGAIMQSSVEIYQKKDMIIKFKGPSLASIDQMKPACTLFCMAHFHSFPKRAKLLEERKINVIAMEEILESPKVQSDEAILARQAMAKALRAFIENDSIGRLNVSVIGRNEIKAAAVRRAGNRDPYSLKMLHKNIRFDELEHVGGNSLYFYDSTGFDDPNGILAKLNQTGSHLFDLHKFKAEESKQSIAAYRKSHPPFEFGLRRIQCLKETGQAGARYGIELLKNNKPNLNIDKAKVVLLGYGNVGQGAMFELYNQGVKTIHILGRTHTAKDRIEHWLKDADLIINGAEQPQHLRGVNFLISNVHLKNTVPKGSVVIDLVGGSESNRSPVEAVLNCTYLTNPHYEFESVTICALWGWPMLGMMKESAQRYSSQIVDVLTGPEKLLNGIDKLTPGVKKALVCGPF
ncbi:MAG: alanine dehydrogenase [Proteobacteria bacterium]|nr:alanine dehydrogenase [Pseudomonadota bacterium]